MPSVAAVAPPRTLALIRDLRKHGDRVAILAPDGTSLTYAELDARVANTAVVLGSGGPRRLVLVAGSNTVGSIVGYLGALAAGHVVLLAPGENDATIDALIETYDPDVVLGRPADPDSEALIAERRPGSRHQLHPELALLLTTSGSTGSPKLVRLSFDNLDANATAIVGSLGIRSDDRVPTTLPMHYAYGLSVIHSHLLAGAAIVVTDLSVVDPCFWDRFRAERATTLNGVPYTFDCLDRIDFPGLDLPHLRSVTQAGGRLDPDRVRGYAELGRQRGWTFTVMYGQTEAGPRMATLPGDLALEHPEAIGRAIPGGDLRIEPIADDPNGVGELVYRGPNVMLGYAAGPEDLALGRRVDELRTGDLGRRLPNGLFEITGRRSSFVKIAGIRVDLDHLERRLQEQGVRGWCAGHDGSLVVAVEGDPDPRRVQLLVSELAAIPGRLVQAVPVIELPRGASGKPDRAAIADLAKQAQLPVRTPAETSALDMTSATAAASTIEGIRDLYTESIGRTPGDDDSFVALGGDSLSYVHVSLGLEELLGRLPAGWPTLSLRDLAAIATPRRRLPRGLDALAVRWVETTVLLRAIAIMCIVGQHTGFLEILGGAHVLVAVAGFNFARFQLTPVPLLDRVRSQARAITRLAVPAVIWIALMLLVVDDYQLQNLFLANAILGPERWDSTWHFWFIEMLLYILVVMAAVLAIPAVDRLERRWPFALAAGVLVIGLALRFNVVDLGVTNPRPILWLFALGWAAGKASMWWQRAAIAVVAILAVPGFYGDPERDAFIAAGVLVIVGLRRLPVPRLIVPIAGVLASASLYIYLVHWQVWKALPDISSEVVFALCMGAGLVAWFAARWGEAAIVSIREALAGQARRPSRSLRVTTTGSATPAK